MNGNEEASTHPRPHSAGFWTLFSWLRRSDRSSSESISSVGSDRTAASFDFLAPLQYGHNHTPLILPSSPPTDTYKKRLQERNDRRLRDRDTSIHRKYGLLKVEDVGYDTLNETSTRSYTSQKTARERRATSECVHRRAAYVPGKRQAPLPPLPVAVTLPRYKRKRPAPKPPLVTKSDKENYDFSQILRMSNKSYVEHDSHVLKSGSSCGQNSSHRNAQEQPKEKSFIKQIFVNRKRNSAIDTSHVKLLPSISELDKEALEIIERKKALNAEDANSVLNSKPKGNVWICTNCLRRYDATIISCLYCVPVKQLSSHGKNIKRMSMVASNNYTQTDAKVFAKGRNGKIDDEKEKLIEMLKEMKNSLPKRSKFERDKINKIDKSITETSTLRIGSEKIEENDNLNLFSKYVSENSNLSRKPDNGMKLKIKVSDKEKFFNLQPASLEQTKKTELSSTNKIPFIDTSLPKGGESSGGSSLSPVQDKKLNVDSSFEASMIKKVPENKIQNQLNRLNSLIEVKEKSDIIMPSSSKSSIILREPKIGKSSILDNLEARSQSKISESKQLSSIDKNCTKSTKLTPDFNKTSEAQAPLKISSLLNPLYSPKSNLNASTDLSETNKLKSNISSSVALSNTSQFTKANTSSPVKVKEETSKPSSSTPVSITTETDTEHTNPYHRKRTLITKLEQSIANGDEKTAAEVAAQLAKLKLACSVLSFSSQIVTDSFLALKNMEKLSDKQPDIIRDIGDPIHKDMLKPETPTNQNIDATRHKNNDSPNIDNERNKTTQVAPSTSGSNATEDIIQIEVWIEDKEAARGPIHLRTRRKATVRELMHQAEASWGLAVHLQRWIVGKTLCTDNNAPLSALAGPDLAAPFYLCLVEADKKPIQTAVKTEADQPTDTTKTNDPKSGDVYLELINLEKEALVLNPEAFECEVCLERRAVGEGVVLRECLHVFCRECLSDAVRHCEEPIVSCPAVGCSGTLQEREVRALLSSEEYEKWLARGLTAAECGTRNTFHCRTKDCNGWAFCEPGVTKFPCPVCKHINCIPCQAVHEEITCKTYQEKLQNAVSAIDKDHTDEGTRALLNSLISKGEALECPECRAIITKKWGCDWVKCSACKTEICWVTRGRRWGPAGRGDTSAGCRCGVAGRRCHPACGYCH